MRHSNKVNSHWRPAHSQSGLWLRRYFTIFLLLISLNSWAINCSQTNITLSSQAEIDAFQATYGNGGICDTITGALNISGLDIENLFGIQDIRQIGSLHVSENPLLTSIEGLVSLETVSSSINILSNELLENLDGFSSLVAGPEFIALDDNATLTDLNGFSSLSLNLRGLLVIDHPNLENLDGLSGVSGEIDGELQIWYNPKLDNLDALTGINAVGGRMEIRGNDGLTSIDGLSNIAQVGQWLWFEGSPSVTDLNAFSGLTSIGWSLIIQGTQLVDLSGLSGLTGSLPGGLLLQSNPELISISGLDGISGNLGSLTLIDNPMLETLNGLEGMIGHMEFGINMWDNGSLKNIYALEGISSIGGRILVTRNAALRNIIGLHNVQSVEETVGVINNSGLKECGALQRLLDSSDDFSPGPGSGSTPDVGEGVSVFGNAQGCTSVAELLADEPFDPNIIYCLSDDILINTQQQVDDFQSVYGLGATCNSIKGDLTISLGAYENLDGLDLIQRVRGNLSLSGTHSDFELRGLDAVTSIDGTFSIHATNLITTFGILPSLSRIGGDFNVSFNQDLQEIVGSGFLVDVGGSIEISNNEALLTVSGFDQIQGSLSWVRIRQNDQLATISGFNLVEHIEHFLSISSIQNLREISGFEALESVGLAGNDDLSLGSLDLELIMGFSSLTEIGGDLEFTQANEPIELQAFNSLERVGQHVLFNNCGFRDLDWLNSLAHVGGIIEISDCQFLESIQGLGNLETLVGGMQITGNQALTDVSNFPLLSTTGTITWAGNHSVTEFPSFAGLNTVTGAVLINANNQLETIDSFQALSVAQNAIAIQQNISLTRVAGFDALEHAEYLAIIENTALSMISGFPMLTGIQTDFVLRDNPLLADCSQFIRVLDRRDDGPPGPGPGEAGIPDIGAGAFVSDNSVGCSSVEEITGFTPLPAISMIRNPNPLHLKAAFPGAENPLGTLRISNTGDEESTVEGSCALVNPDPQISLSNGAFAVNAGAPAHFVSLSCDASSAGNFAATLRCSHNAENMASPREFPVTCTVSIAPETESETGPNVPCTGCENRINTPLPASGPWADTELDGSGFLFRVQNETLAGWYFGYSDSGDSDWLLFSGALQPGQSAEVLWKVEASLTRFTGGSCPDCAYSPPQDTSGEGIIEVEFLQKNHARFRVNGGPDHYITPLHFGAGGEALFAAQTPYILPNLAGPTPTAWVFVETTASGEPLEPVSTQVFHLKKPESGGNYPYEFESVEHSILPTDPLPPALSVDCGEGQSQPGLHCRVTVRMPPNARHYEMPLGNLGHNRFFAEDEQGNRVEAFRINFD
ncbi:MAG: hypothetical protein HKO64_09745 [Xanthomonadales bacterium]|nr:hypothetical protein [Xanthomonadales bacterium]